MMMMMKWWWSSLILQELSWIQKNTIQPSEHESLAFCWPGKSKDNIHDSMQNSLADSNRVTNRNYVIVNPLLHFTDVELLCRNVVNKSLLLLLNWMNRSSFLLGPINYVSTTPRGSETQHLT